MIYKLKHITKYFTKNELILWCSSMIAITVSFLIFNRENFLTLFASLIGVTSLILNAKGNPFGQLLMVIFSILYGVISFSFSYYGEMITYLCMTAPIAVISIISWLKHPYEGSREVEIHRVTGRQTAVMAVLTAAVTAAFYFILSALNNANIIFSTLSVTTSFAASYLTFLRSPFYAVAYAANDVVLIILWILASIEDISYLPMIICFVMFLLNDIYGFYSWEKRQKEQIAKKRHVLNN